MGIFRASLTSALYTQRWLDPLKGKETGWGCRWMLPRNLRCRHRFHCTVHGTEVFLKTVPVLLKGWRYRVTDVSSSGQTHGSAARRLYSLPVVSNLRAFCRFCTAVLTSSYCKALPAYLQYFWALAKSSGVRRISPGRERIIKILIRI